MAPFISAYALVQRAKETSNERLGQLMQPIHEDVIIHSTLSLDSTSTEQIWACFEANMKALYLRSNEGYDAVQKRQEVFAPDNRFALLFRSRSFVGFACFQFDVEEGQPILYCLELQVKAAFARQRLGSVLCKCLVELARGCQMSRILLTVFKYNVAARSFYDSHNFIVDESCPSRYPDLDHSKIDYLILSRKV